MGKNIGSVLKQCNKLFKVTLCGAGSPLGQSMSLLLKQSPLIKSLDLYEEKHNICGQVLDLFAIETSCKVRGFVSPECLTSALANADIVILANNEYEALPIKKQIDAIGPEAVRIARVISKACPQAIVAVASSPVNILTVITTEALKEFGCYDCGRVLGMTAVHSARTNAVFASCIGASPNEVNVPLIGGATSETILPLFSYAQPNTHLKKGTIKKMTEIIRSGEHNILKKKRTPEHLNKAFSSVRFIQSVMYGLCGKTCVTECAFTKNVSIPNLSYLTLPLVLGPKGVKKTYDIPELSDYECKLLKGIVKNVNKDSDLAIQWIEKQLPEINCCKFELQ